ncbi:MAG: hypothetical protein JOS17DRAFT_804697 [Linnemannia elongata]|nr:MAG: hypothetical protein JOS17DRAFT_804697 [Linnemannia elongata]
MTCYPMIRGRMSYCRCHTLFCCLFTSLLVLQTHIHAISLVDTYQLLPSSASKNALDGLLVILLLSNQLMSELLGHVDCRCGRVWRCAKVASSVKSRPREGYDKLTGDKRITSQGKIWEQCVDI